MPSRIPASGQQKVLLVILMRRVSFYPLGHFSVVPVHDINHLVRPQDHRVITVFSFTFKLLKKVHFVGLEIVVVVGVN